jgi:DNA-binding transcriptional ArsR family regulator
MKMNSLDPLFSALGDPTRRQVVEMLSDGREMTVNEVAQKFAMSRQAVAKHLAILRDADVIRSEKHGRERVHVLVPRRMTALSKWVEHYSEFWDGKLAGLKKLIEEEQTHVGNKKRD